MISQEIPRALTAPASTEAGAGTSVPKRSVHYKSAQSGNWSEGRLPCPVATLAITMVLAIAVGLTTPAAAQKKPEQTVSIPTYARDIRPVLQARCVVCHSTSAVSAVAVSGGLALDSYAAIKTGVAGTKTEAELAPGKGSQSALYTRLVTTSPSKLMPKGGPALAPAQISLIKRWIDAGAPEGIASKGAVVAPLPAEALPMPVNRAAIAVSVPARIELPAGALDKGITSSALALKVGPLPPVTALAYSPDGKRLAIGGYRAVALWDTTTGQPAVCLTHLPGAVLALAFTPDGTALAVGSGIPGASGDIRVYDTTHWTPMGKPLGGHADVVVSICWSADGTRIASGSQDKTARVWEWPSSKELRLFKDHSDGVTRVCFAPDGKSLYTASLDHNARRYDLEKGGLIRLFTGHNEGINALAVSPDGKRLITSGGEPNLRWWNTETGDTTNNNGGHGGSVTEVIFAKDGKLVASASSDKTLRLWDGSNTQQKRALEGSSDWVYAAAVSPDDKFAAGGGADGIVRIWEATTGRLCLSLLFWPPPKDGVVFDWAAITPEGYVDGSQSWAGKLSLLHLAKAPASAKLQSAVRILIQPASVLKAWQGAPLDPVRLAPK